MVAGWDYRMILNTSGHSLPFIPLLPYWVASLFLDESIFHASNSFKVTQSSIDDMNTKIWVRRGWHWWRAYAGLAFFAELSLVISHYWRRGCHCQNGENIWWIIVTFTYSFIFYLYIHSTQRKMNFTRHHASDAVRLSVESYIALEFRARCWIAPLSFSSSPPQEVALSSHAGLIYFTACHGDEDTRALRRFQRHLHHDWLRQLRHAGYEPNASSAW